MTHPADLSLPASDQTAADISADDILRRVYALPAPQQRRVVKWLRAHPHADLRACARPLEAALSRRQLKGARHDAA